MSRSGFTLIEVLAVIVVLGLLAGAVAWSLAGDATQAIGEDALGRLAHADSMARAEARRFGREYTLRFDLNEQALRRLDEGDRQSAHSVKLPTGHRIEAVAFKAQGDSGSGTLRRVTFGAADVVYSPAGRSVSYAVRIRSGDARRWLVVAGLTGQVTQTDDAKAVDNLFDAGLPRADAR